MLDVVQMLQHQRRSAVRAPARYCRQQLFVLVLSARCRMRRVVQKDRKACQSGQASHSAGQSWTASMVSQAHVELASQAHHGGTILPNPCILLFFNKRSKIFQGLRIPPGNDTAHQSGFDQPPCLKDVARFLRGWRSNERPAIRNDANHSLVSKPRQNIPNLGATGIEKLGQTILHQLGARWKPMFQDSPLNTVIDDVSNLNTCRCTHGFSRSHDFPLSTNLFAMMHKNLGGF